MNTYIYLRHTFLGTATAMRDSKYRSQWTSRTICSILVNELVRIAYLFKQNEFIIPIEFFFEYNHIHKL